MINELMKLSSLQPDTLAKGYSILRYPHSSTGRGPTFFGDAKTLEEAQEFCSRPESSFKEGPEEDWYYYGYVENSSRTHYFTAWRIFQ